MSREEVYVVNLTMQTMTYRTILDCRMQNYEQAVMRFSGVVKELSRVLADVFSDIDFYNQEMELINPEAVSASLQEIMTAQENKDYVLFADLLELQLIPFIQSLQEAIRTYDGSEVDEEVWEKI